jgi:hypothetical protein
MTTTRAPNQRRGRNKGRSEEVPSTNKSIRRESHQSDSFVGPSVLVPTTRTRCPCFPTQPKQRYRTACNHDPFFFGRTPNEHFFSQRSLSQSVSQSLSVSYTISIVVYHAPLGRNDSNRKSTYLRFLDSSLQLLQQPLSPQLLTNYTRRISSYLH